MMQHNFAHSGFHYPFVVAVIGLLLLLLGRSLFWLFVAAAGFVIGAEITPLILPHQSELFTILVALFLGIFGAILAICVQKLAVCLAGFAGGAYLAITLLQPRTHAGFLQHSVAAGPFWWLWVLAAGVIGAIVMIAFFNWALIIFSSAQGAHFILQAFPAPAAYQLFLFIALAIIGILVQAATYRRTPRTRPD